MPIINYKYISEFLDSFPNFALPFLDLGGRWIFCRNGGEHQDASTAGSASGILSNFSPLIDIIIEVIIIDVIIKAVVIINVDDDI